MTQATVDQIADELRAGYDRGGGMGAVDALAKRLAPEIVVWHIPPMAADHDMTAEFVTKARTLEVESFARAMPDYQERGDIAVEGDDIVHNMRVSGTYKDKPTNITLACRWTVADGQITKMGSYTTEDSPIIYEIFFANPDFAAFAGGLADLVKEGAASGTARAVPEAPSAERRISFKI